MADDAKLVEARKRVTRAERKALDRALALRDEAEHLIEAARNQAAKIREDAKAEAARMRKAARDANVDSEPSETEDESAAEARAVAILQTALDEARAAAATARDERDAAQAKVATATEEAKAARADRDRAKSEVTRLEAELAAAAFAPGAGEPAGKKTEQGRGAGDDPAVDQQDLLALVALVEAIEAERDALVAEVAELRGESPTP